MKDAARKFMNKAERALISARRLLDVDDAEAAAGRAYYSMFYVAEALLTEEGLSFSKHSGVQSALGVHFVKSGRLNARHHRNLLAAFNKRIAADYGVDAVVSKDEVEAMIRNAREFYEDAKQIMNPQSRLF